MGWMCDQVKKQARAQGAEALRQQFFSLCWHEKLPGEWKLTWNGGKAAPEENVTHRPEFHGNGKMVSMFITDDMLTDASSYISRQIMLLVVWEAVRLLRAP